MCVCVFTDPDGCAASSSEGTTAYCRAITSKELLPFIGHI